MLMSSCVDSDCVVFTFSLTMHSLPCGYLSEWAEGRRQHPVLQPESSARHADLPSDPGRR